MIKNKKPQIRAVSLGTVLAMIVFTVTLMFGTVPTMAYTSNDMIYLARVINAEAGEGCSIEHNQLVGCVVMNRVNDDRFPSNIYDVINQKGQYSSVGNSRFNAYPSQIAINAAKYVLEGKAYCPSNVLYQSNGRQGNGVYKKINVDTGYFSSTTYFCYG